MNESESSINQIRNGNKNHMIMSHASSRTCVIEFRSSKTRNLRESASFKASHRTCENVNHYKLPTNEKSRQTTLFSLCTIQ
jgi:hypothetical protein